MKANVFKLTAFCCFLIFIGGCNPKNLYQFQSSAINLPSTTQSVSDSIPILTAQLEPSLLIENQANYNQNSFVKAQAKPSVGLAIQKPLSLPKKIIKPLLVKSNNNLKSLKAHDIADGDYLLMFLKFVLGILLIVGIIVGLIVLIF